MVFMVSAISILIPFHRICLNWLGPFEIGQILDHGEEFVVWDIEGSETSLGCLLSILPLTSLYALFAGLELSTELFLAFWLVTRTYWVAVWTSFQAWSTCLLVWTNRPSLLEVFWQQIQKRVYPGRCFFWKFEGRCLCYKVLLEAQHVRTSLQTLSITHSPASLWFAKYWCSAYAVLSTDTVPQRPPTNSENYSRNSSEGDGTMKETSHGG